MSILIFGHKNPDTDSVASTLALSDLKKQLGYDTTPCVLGNINKESEYILKYFNLKQPEFIDNVNTQVKDLNFDKATGFSPTTSVLRCYKVMESKNIKTLGITDENNNLLGIITMKDIAMSLIGSNFYNLKTSTENILYNFKGELLTGGSTDIEGKIYVIAYHYSSAKDVINENCIIIVGDRYDIIEHAIKCKVKLIILTGDRKIPHKYLDYANKNNVVIISVPTDTYTTSKLINQCNYVSTIMKTENISKFSLDDYLENVKEETLRTSYRSYPIIDNENKFIGTLSRRHVLNPGKKKVILVDHNEYNQSADGISESEILEIIDHHKIGDITTDIPISFKNIPVGSTCTIIYTMYKEYNLTISKKIAGALISGIISDTLFLKSPTTTSIDKRAVEELNKILNLDIEDFSLNMFKAGTSLEGRSIEDIFFKDFKEFNLAEQKIGISQVFTLDIDNVLNRKNQFIDLINKTFKHNGYYLTLLLVTDILKEGSYLLYKCKNDRLIPLAFNTESTQGAFAKEMVSRKKQVLPRILSAFNILN